MSASAGWYADPQQVGTLRYWDGQAWTDQRAPAAPAIVRSQREVWLAYVLLIFLGTLGIHRFYVGDSSGGVAQLVLTLIGWATSWLLFGFALLAVVLVWLIVDLFLMPDLVRRANA